MTCPERLFCHAYGRGRGRSVDQRIPSWPYHLMAALESGPTSWTAILDAVRLVPGADATAASAAQLRAVVGRLRAAGHWRAGDPAIMVVMDSGDDVSRPAFLLADLPVHLVGRLRADRVMFAPTPPRSPDPHGGRPRQHGSVMALADRTSWAATTTQTSSATDRYGQTQVLSFEQMHLQLTPRGSWARHDGPLPIVEGTVIRPAVEHLPGQREAAPVRLWSSATGAHVEQVTRCWQAYLRRFDLEHTFHLKAGLHRRVWVSTPEARVTRIRPGSRPPRWWSLLLCPPRAL